MRSYQYCFRFFLIGLFFSNIYYHVLAEAKSPQIESTQAKALGTALNTNNLKNLRFTYQPYESAGINCSFEFEADGNDFIVTCDKHQFQIHFFARPHQHPSQNSLEILAMCHRKTNTNEISQYASTSASFWIFTSKSSELISSLLSLGVDNDTASLQIRFEF